MKNDVTFEIKVYENDWEHLLIGEYLDKIIGLCNYDFKKKYLFINNVTNLNEVKKYADIKVKNGIIDEYFVVYDYVKEALKYFNIEKESFKNGYYYSISELVSIYLCQTNYLLHFSSDSYLDESQVNWIDKAITIFKERDDIIVANPVWNFAYKEAKKESLTEMDDFYVGYGFSDQCYLIKTNVFKEQIYNEKHIDSDRYPKYGGELFEKRVDSFMRNHKKLRITSKEISYIHKNFTKKMRNKNDVINEIITNNGYTSYLEIGYQDGDSFNGVNCDIKYSVDPNGKADFNGTSDDFFKQLPINKKYHIIFIDGLHHSDQVRRDIINASKFLYKSGAIVLHDVNPTTKQTQLVPCQSSMWEGDVWRAFVGLRKTYPNVKTNCLLDDHGVGIIYPMGAKFNGDFEDMDMSYEDFAKDKEALLGV